MTKKHFLFHFLSCLFLTLTSCGNIDQTEEELPFQNTVHPPINLQQISQSQKQAVVQQVAQPSRQVAQPGRQTHLATGHKKVREILGTDIGQMQFDSGAANKFRSFLANSLLSDRANNYDRGSYTDSQTKIQFCADGSFMQSSFGHVSIDVGGYGGASASTDYMPGYWEVASLPNGMLIILFYSTHPLMLEDSPNGFLPFPVAQYSANFVALPNGDGYSRIGNQPCY